MTTSEAWPWKVTVGNRPRSGATAPSLSHRNWTPSTPTPPVSRPGPNSSQCSLKNSSGPIPLSAGASGRGPPMHRKPSPGRASSMSSTSVSLSAAPPGPSSQHSAATVAASSAARSAVSAARPPRPAHNTNTVISTSTGTSSTSSRDIVPASPRRPRLGPARARADDARLLLPPPNPRPQVEVEVAGLAPARPAARGAEPESGPKTTRPARPEAIQPPLSSTMVPVPVSLRPGTPVSSMNSVSEPSTTSSSQTVTLISAWVCAGSSVTEPEGVM